MFGSSIAIDMGTANTRIFVGGADLLIDEPTIAVREGSSFSILGQPARILRDRLQAGTASASDLKIVAPVTRGAVTDVNLACAFVLQLLRERGNRGFRSGTRILLTRAASITAVERQALIDLGKGIGSAGVGLVPTLIAAAIGAGVSTEKPKAHLILDLGAGTSEAGVVSMNGLVSSASTEVAGDALDALIAEHVRTEHGLLIGRCAAEAIKQNLGCALEPPPGAMKTVGRCAASGLTASAIITSSEIQAVLAKPLHQIAEMVRNALADVTPEVCSDLFSTGVLVTGGGAQLNGLDRYLETATGLPVRVPANPARCAVVGLAQLVLQDNRRGRSAA